MDPATIAALVTAGSGLVANWYNKRQEKKEYAKMQEYNSPKMQMKRYSEAGLSPYLIYGQGSSGNVSSPSPAYSVPEDVSQKSIGAYTGMSAFDLDMKAKRLDNAIRAKNLSMLDTKGYNMELSGISTALKNLKTSLETLADFPGYNSDDGTVIQDKHVANSYRRKLNELKMAASQAAIDKVRVAIQGMGYENSVKRIKAKYANDYGMVGGDWTQGLGLVKSLMNPRYIQHSRSPVDFKRAGSKRYVKP